MKAPSMIFTAFYRGFHHGAFSFRVLSWSSSRCTLLLRSIVVFIAVHFHFALYQIHIWCTPFYRGVHHGALFSPYRVSTWCTSFAFYRGLYHGALHSIVVFITVHFPSCSIVVFITVHFVFAFYQVSIWCTPLYRGPHHGALHSIVVSITVHSVLSRSSSRCTLLFVSILVFIKVHFPFASYLGV